MKIKLMNGNVLEMLRNIPDESVDCVVSSPPYYGLRDYSGVATYASEDYDELLRIANTGLQNHRDRVLESQRDRYYLTKPVFNEKDNKWHTSLKYDISGIWGGNSECEHEWIEYVRKGQDSGRNSDKLNIKKSNEENFQLVENQKQNLCSKCGAWKGQLGLEPTYQLYVEHLMLVMKELKRILKKTGTLFWNMGDSYASSGGPSRHFGYPDPKWDKARNGSFEEPTAFKQGIKPKSLMGIPERFMIAMLDDGWVLRNKLPWIKMNAMPSSKKDGFTPKWEYVYFFTKKSQSYYFDLDSIRKPLAESSVKRISQKNIPNQFKSGKSMEFAETNPVNNIPKILNNMHNSFNIRVRDAKKGILDKKWGNKYTASDEEIANYDEKNYTSKTSNNTYQKYQQDGAYKGSHSGYLNEDGSLRVNLSGANPGDVLFDDTIYDLYTDPNIQDAFIEYLELERPELLMPSILDIPTMPHSFAHFAVFPETLVEPLIKAGCPSDGVVFDPFAGSGTVGVVAMKQNKNAILIEISPEYCDIIKKRLNWGAGLGVEYESFPRADIMEAPNE
jgi:DNA modification methylase